MRLALMILVLLAAGCTKPAPTAPTQVTVPTPAQGNGYGQCHSTAAQLVAVPFEAESTNDSLGHPPGVHRLNETTFLFVWERQNDSLRQDRITRLNSVDVYREPDPAAPLSVCTRVDIAAPTDVDGERRTYDVAARFTATHGLPNASTVRVLVDWNVGCPCAEPVRGHDEATFAS